MVPLLSDDPFVGRYVLLKATWTAEEGEKHECVPNDFDNVEDDKRLKRELGALSRLRHPNILPSQAVCEGHARYYP